MLIVIEGGYDTEMMPACHAGQLVSLDSTIVRMICREAARRYSRTVAG